MLVNLSLVKENYEISWCSLIDIWTYNEANQHQFPITNTQIQIQIQIHRALVG